MFDSGGSRRLSVQIMLAIGLGTAIAYWPLRHAGFVNFDDGVFVVGEPMVKGGLSWVGILWAFHTTKSGIWMPLVWLSHMAVCQFFGTNPLAHHLVNVLLHVATALLLYVTLKQLTRAMWRSALVAALFAWHPMHVESVAWVSERKDVLSGLFFVLTVWSYGRYAQSTDAKRLKLFHLSALLFFALGLLCKPMLVTVPIVLLLLDYWPLAREATLVKRLLEKIPFFVLSATAALIALYSQAQSRALATEPLMMRLSNSVVSIVEYLRKMFWPSAMGVFYPFRHNIPMWQVIGAAVAIVAISVWVFRRSRARYLMVGWTWFLVTLQPVIGIVHIGMQSMADRYTYIPYIGLFVAVSWGVADLGARFQAERRALPFVVAVAMVGLIPISFYQCGFWRDNTTLFEHAAAVVPDNWLAHSNLGDEALNKRDFARAEKECKEVIRIMPGYSGAYVDLAHVYQTQNRLEDTIGVLREAVIADSGNAEAHYNLGIAYSLQRQFDKAIAEIREAVRLKPADNLYKKSLAEVLLTRAAALYEHHRSAEAIAAYKEALVASPDLPEALNGAAWVYATATDASLRNGGEAVRLAERATQLSGDTNPQILDTLGAAYAEVGRFEDALRIAGKMSALAKATGDTNSGRLAQQRVESFRRRQPVRE
jgi:tetratricopeptide (TPR) repeat protein